MRKMASLRTKAPSLETFATAVSPGVIASSAFASAMVNDDGSVRARATSE